MGLSWRWAQGQESFLGLGLVFVFTLGEIIGCLCTNENELVKRGNLMMQQRVENCWSPGSNPPAEGLASGRSTDSRSAVTQNTCAEVQVSG